MQYTLLVHLCGESSQVHPDVCHKTNVEKIKEGKRNCLYDTLAHGNVAQRRDVVISTRIPRIRA
jgi:hypothetical protein